MCTVNSFPHSAISDAEKLREAETSDRLRHDAVRAMYRELTYGEFVHAQLARMSRRKASTWSYGKKIQMYRYYQELFQMRPADLPSYLLRRIEG